jgi:hypothetical protein
MGGRLRKLLALTPAELVLLGRAYAALIAVHILLRVRGFVASMRAFDHPVPHRTQAAPPETQAQQAAITARLVHAAARTWPLHANCLRRAIVLRWLLARQGIPSEIRIGVRKEEAALAAHAWVECSGAPVGDRPTVTETYGVFPGDVATLVRWVE